MTNTIYAQTHLKVIKLQNFLISNLYYSLNFTFKLHKKKITNLDIKIEKTTFNFLKNYIKLKIKQKMYKYPLNFTKFSSLNQIENFINNNKNYNILLKYQNFFFFNNFKTKNVNSIINYFAKLDENKNYNKLIFKLFFLQN